MTATAAGLDAIPEVSIAVADEDGHGHLAEMRIDPVALFERVHAECGEIGRFRIAGKEVIMVTGAEVNEQFFKSPDSTLDQAAAYPFMTPIFGKGVVFDASPEERQQALKNQALRGDKMRGHATTIENEITRMVAEWGDEGEVDLLDFFAELTIYNTAACLVGLPFREEIDQRFADAYHGLERGTDALAYVDPYMEGVESFEIRDRSRETLVELVQGIIDRRKDRAGRSPREERDLLDVLISLDVERRLHHRHVHLDALRRSPHVVGHVGLDADRADAAPGRDGRGRRRSSTTCTPTGRRSRSRRCARSRSSSRSSRRRCGCTRR